MAWSLATWGTRFYTCREDGHPLGNPAVTTRKTRTSLLDLLTLVSILSCLMFIVTWGLGPWASGLSVWPCGEAARSLEAPARSAPWWAGAVYEAEAWPGL